jgi:hypothetical protein
MRQALLALCCVLFCVQVVSAQIGADKKPPADPRVKGLLDEIGYKYELDANNDYKLVPIRTEEDSGKTGADGKPAMRSQLVYVNSNTERYGSLEIREVLAPAFLLDNPPSAEIANRLLRENNTVKLGAWRMVVINNGPNKGKWLAMFAAQIAANSDAESLRLTIKSVILIADRMEKAVTNADDY